jgi:hypothetical protein
MLRIPVRLAAACACAVLWLAAPALGGPAPRSWTITAAPAPGDFSLLELSFPRAGVGHPSAASLRVDAVGPFGDDYLAAAAVSGGPSRRARALVLVVNRPSPLLDPAEVDLRVSAPRSLGVPITLRAGDVLARRLSSRPLLCDLPDVTRSLPTTDLLALDSQGSPLNGFDADAALAQAYDASCGLAYSSAFAQAVQGAPACGAGAGTQGTVCCPPTADCAPSPVSPSPPQPGPPGCVPCDPTPGRACPMVTRGAICINDATRAPEPAPAGSY